MLNALTTKAYVKVTEAIRSFKEGVTAIEYGLIAVAIAVLIVAVFYNKGGFIDALKTKFSTLTTKVSGATI